MLSIVSKTLERCVLNHISHHIQSNIHSAQFGFVSGRSCATQLLSILNIIGKNLDKDYKLTLFLWTLRRLSTPLTTPSCCKNCVNLVSLVLFSCGFKIIQSGGFQRLTVHGATSQSLPITSSSFIKALALVPLIAPVTTLVDSHALVLQEDIRSIQSWSEENHFRLDNSKCKVLSITRKSSPVITSYRQLALSNTEIDLGVVMNSNLTWINQVNKVRSKANQMLGFIRRSTMEMHDVGRGSTFTYNWFATTLRMHRLKYDLHKQSNQSKVLRRYREGRQNTF